MEARPVAGAGPLQRPGNPAPRRAAAGEVPRPRPRRHRRGRWTSRCTRWDPEREWPGPERRGGDGRPGRERRCAAGRRGRVQPAAGSAAGGGDYDRVRPAAGRRSRSGRSAVGWRCRVSLDLCPLVSFDRVTDGVADHLLEEWGNWLGGCNRPFGRQSFGLQLAEVGIIAVAVSASTVNPTCAGYNRQEVVELARLCAHPDHRWATRVTLRLWRETAPTCWSGKYWPVRSE